MKPDCLFCKIVARQLPSDVVYEDGDVLAFNDINPQAPTHVLIIPKQHVATVNDVADADAAVFSTLVLRCSRHSGRSSELRRRVIGCCSTCNAAGGQTVYHLHLHLLGGRQLKGLG